MGDDWGEERERERGGGGGARERETYSRQTRTEKAKERKGTIHSNELKVYCVYSTEEAKKS